TWYATGYEYISKSIDNGSTWTTVYSQGALLLGADFLTPEFGIAAGDYGQVITTKDGGATWTEDVIMDWLFHKPFIWDDDTAYVVGTPEYIYKTTDAGQNWVSDYDGNWMKAFYNITFTDNYTGFVCGGSNGIILRKKPGIITGPVISATPNPLGFENTNVGETSEEILTIGNTGDATLEVTNITTTNPVFTVDMTSFTVEPGETQDVTVYFDPATAGYTEGLIQIENNSTLNAYDVMVSGTGIASGPAPVIIPNPNLLYWNDTYIASQSQQSLFIFNAGDADLVLTEAIFDGPFETYNSFPITIAPGVAYNQVIHFKPFELGLIEGSVTYFSNDPVNPEMEVTLIGRCIDDPINGWEWIYTGHNYILTDIEFPEGQDQIGYTVGQTVTYNGLGIVLKTTDGGDNWIPMTQYGIAGVERCSFPTLETGYAVGWDDDIMKTTDGGQTWQYLNVVNNVFYYSSVEFKDENKGVIIAKMNSGPNKALYTIDGGETWTEGTGLDAFEDITWAGGDTWYATGYSNVCKSTDNGATWTTVFSQGALLLGADFLTPDFGIAASDYGQVITTRDGGQTWETDVIWDILFHKPFIWDEDTAYVVGTPEYVYKTINSCETWESDFDGNWMKAFYKITFTDNYTGFICGGSNGIVCRKKPSSAILTPPTNLAASVNGPDVTLTWDAPAPKTLTGYNIYRNEEKINTDPVTETTYFDEDVVAGSHYYTVTAVYTEGESGPSNPVEVLIDGSLGKIHGFLRDAITNFTLQEAAITASNADNGDVAIYTPWGAYYWMWLTPGTYDVTCSSPGYETMTAYGLEVIENLNTHYTFYLMPLDGGSGTLTGIGEQKEGEINVYPNPAIDQISISGRNLVRAEIYNHLGALVMNGDLSTGIQQLSVEDLQSGIYYIRIYTNSSVEVKQVIIN
nr:choice-of-anchor D domain-containing protein [Bacteroidota bacterium]